MKKRLCCAILSFFIFVSSAFYVCSIEVEAVTFAKIWEYFQIVMALDNGNVISSDLAQDFYNKYKDHLDAIAYTENSDGTITFSEDAIKQIRDLFDEYLSENPEQVDLIWTPVITEQNLKVSWFSSVDSYYKAMSVLNDHDLVGFYRYERLSGGSPVMDYPAWNGEKNVYTPVFMDLSDVVIHFGASFSDTTINAFTYLTTTFGNDTTTNPAPNIDTKFIDQTGINVDLVWYWNVGNGWVNPVTTSSDTTFSKTRYRGVYNPFFSSNLPTTNGWFNYFVPVASSKSDIHYVPIFSTANAYKDWITGNGSYYRFDSGYTGGDLTINPDADYSEIIGALQDVMKQSVANGETMATMLSRMQSSFTKTLSEISGTLGDIEDNTAQTNTWLEKIYELLENQQKELLDYFESSGQSFDDLIGLLSHTGEDGKVTSIYDALGMLLVLFRVQQEDLQDFMEASQDFMKTLPYELHTWFGHATNDIVEAVQDTGQAIVDAIHGISINYDDYVDDDSGGESLWTQLGKGLAKILTALLGLLKTLIFKGLDALIYLVGVVVDNMNGVYDEITVYVDNIVSDLMVGNELYVALGEAIPAPIQNLMVLFVFVLVFCAVVSYMRR